MKKSLLSYYFHQRKQKPSALRCSLSLPEPSWQHFLVSSNEILARREAYQLHRNPVAMPGLGIATGLQCSWYSHPPFRFAVSGNLRNDIITIVPCWNIVRIPLHIAMFCWQGQCDVHLWCSIGATHDLEPQTCLKFSGFKKRDPPRRESARARERECDSEGEISLPRPRTLAILSLAFFKRSKFQTRLEISCENPAFLFSYKKARLEIASGPNGTPYTTDTLNPSGIFLKYRVLKF